MIRTKIPQNVYLQGLQGKPITDKRFYRIKKKKNLHQCLGILPTLPLVEWGEGQKHIIVYKIPHRTAKSQWTEQITEEMVTALWHFGLRC